MGSPVAGVVPHRPRQRFRYTHRDPVTLHDHRCAPVLTPHISRILVAPTGTNHPTSCTKSVKGRLRAGESRAGRGGVKVPGRRAWSPAGAGGAQPGASGRVIAVRNGGVEMPATR